MARIPKERTEWATKDPQGRSILLRTDDWVNHIIIMHPEMFGCQDEVRITIQEPDEIHEEWDGGIHSLIYWKSSDRWPDNLYLKVVGRETGPTWSIRTA